jgi:uncharacterized membrane protein
MQSDNQEVSVTEQLKVSASWSGPLPPPQAFAAYEEIHPGAAERILTAAEQEASHRRAMERRFLDQFHWRSIFGTTTATLVAIIVLGLAGYAFYAGYPWHAVGLFGGLSGLGVVVSLFLRNSPSPDQDTKALEQGTD